jgi:hypothetical protein
LKLTATRINGSATRLWGFFPDWFGVQSTLL